MANPPKWLSSLLRWLVVKARQVIGNLPNEHQPTDAQTLIFQPVVISLKAYATVVIPALNEAKRISEVVAFALSDPATAEVIVVDDKWNTSVSETEWRYFCEFGCGTTWCQFQIVELSDSGHLAAQTLDSQNF